MKSQIALLTILAGALVGGKPFAHAASSCNGPNGSLFNLEARTNAVVQVAQSVAFLPGRTGQGNDLVVSTASDARGLLTNTTSTLQSEDAFYVQRSSENCVADFE